MAYDDFFADRIRQILNRKQCAFEEKKMMGGLCFMVDDKMCVGIVKEKLMVRVNPDDQENLLKRDGAMRMDFTGRPMKGFLFVDPIGCDIDDDLVFWVEACLSFNPLAKSSKKKKNN